MREGEKDLMFGLNFYGLMFFFFLLSPRMATHNPGATGHQSRKPHKSPENPGLFDNQFTPATRSPKSCWPRWCAAGPPCPHPQLSPPHAPRPSQALILTFSGADPAPSPPGFAPATHAKGECGLIRTTAFSGADPAGQRLALHRRPKGERLVPALARGPHRRALLLDALPGWHEVLVEVRV